MSVVDYAVVNPALNEQAREIRRTIPMRGDPGDLTDYIRCWSEEDVLGDRPCKALVVILKTRGCTWALAGGCTMCGYANESAWQKVSEDQLVAQFEKGWAQYKGEELVKIYTSGSFVDRHEVMPGAQRRIMEMIGGADTVKKVAFESLPGFIQEDTFTDIAGFVPQLEVGIGVESSNLRVLRDSVNKGHDFDTFPRAAAICKEHQVSVKAYLMCKPPFLKESDALTDAANTVAAAAPHANVVSLNPTNIQGRTVVDELYKRGSYRAPWLWTIVHALKDGYARGAAAAGSDKYPATVKSDVIAAGQERGAHNCGQCDERVGKYLKKFKATQDPKWLDECLTRVQCKCRREWELTLELGPLIPAYGQL